MTLFAKTRNSNNRNQTVTHTSELVKGQNFLKLNKERDYVKQNSLFEFW